MNLYIIINELFKKLAQLYNNSNKETKFRRKYNNLT